METIEISQDEMNLLLSSLNKLLDGKLTADVLTAEKIVLVRNKENILINIVTSRR